MQVFAKNDDLLSKGSESKLPEALDDLSRQASRDGFQLNEPSAKNFELDSPTATTILNP